MLYAGHLCDGKLDAEKKQQFSEKVLSRLHNIERQIQDMLFYVKGELPLNDMISVNELEHALNESMEAVLMSSHSTCEWNNQAGEYYIQCNRDALVGALLNLVNNAIQAVEHHAQLSIAFKLKKSEKNAQLIIQISDQGPGMAPDILAKAGDLFVTTKSQGTGLGLSVVQAVVRAHAGEFLLESQAGQGTCANLLLPLVNY
jgi:two-component system sensor histidine kinase FlrB